MYHVFKCIVLHLCYPEGCIDAMLLPSSNVQG